MTKRKTPEAPTAPTPIRPRISGFLHCKRCERTWPYTGVDAPETWPLHRCLRGVSPMSEFSAEDRPYQRTFIAEVEAELDAALATLRRTVRLD